MSVLRFEVSKNGDDWSTVGELHPGDQYGSVSDQHDDGTSHVYMFGIDPVENVGEVKRSIAGFDIETGEDRMINSVGFEPVAQLALGEHHDMMIKTRQSSATVLIRFTYS